MASAADVAAELVRRLGPLHPAKLHALLYYCQCHHLAHFGVPLFPEAIYAAPVGFFDDAVTDEERAAILGPPT